MNNIEKWIEIKNQIKELQAQELELRKEIINEKFSNSVIGTNHNDNLTLVRGLTYKVNTDELNAIKDTLDNEFIDTKSLFKVSYSLNLKEYKNLTVEQKNMVDNCLTITEKSPDLKIKEEK